MIPIFQQLLYRNLQTPIEKFNKKLDSNEVETFQLFPETYYQPLFLDSKTYSYLETSYPFQIFKPISWELCYT